MSEIGTVFPHVHTELSFLDTRLNIDTHMDQDMQHMIARFIMLEYT